MNAFRHKRLNAPLLLALLMALFLLAPVISAGAADAGADSPSVSQVPVVKGYPIGSELPALLMIQFPNEPLWAPPLIIEAPDQGGISLSKIGFRPAPGGDEASLKMLCRLVVTPATDAAPGRRTVNAVLVWSLRGQPDQPPRRHEFSFNLDILPAGTKPELAASPKMLKALGLNVQTNEPAQAASMAQAPAQASEPPAQASEPPAQAAAPPAPATDREDPFSGESTLWVLALVFLAGLGLNLTPCVYPLIPITVSYFGGREGGGRRGLIMSALAYLAGMSLTYSALGSAVALGGGMLGAALTHPAVTLVIVAILLALATSMFGLWEIRLPASLNRMAASNRAGILGALLMGLTVGLLAAPCVGPFVVGLMVHVGKVGLVAYGFAVFLVFSLGLGLPLTVLALFSGSLERLPGSGVWMIWIRKFFGVVLVLMAVYMAEPLLGTMTYNYLMVLAALGGGIYLAFGDKTGTGGFTVFKRLMALALVVVVGLFLWLSLPPTKEGKVDWTHSSPRALALAHENGKPTLVLFTADWCPPCKKLKAETFPDSKVSQALSEFNTIKVDLTSNPGPDDKALALKHGVRGVPTMILFDPSGKWLKDLTMVGFVSPRELLTRLGSAQPKK